MNVVVVESPAKAKTINKNLGKHYNVLASYGHVRDLPAKDGSVRPDEDFSMSWLVDERGEKRLSEIAEAVGIPLGTVKSRLHHALSVLRKSPRIVKYFGRPRDISPKE